MKSASEEVLLLTQELLRFNTVNPPWQEKACVDFLAERLNESGFEVGAILYRCDLGPSCGRIGNNGECALCEFFIFRRKLGNSA